MNVMTLLAALLAGAAVLLIVYGLFGRRRTGVEERLERYVTPQSTKPAKASDADRPGVGKMIAGSAAFAVFNRVVERRNWSADMARELARADLSLKPSEFLAIRIGVIVAIPAIGFLLGMTILPTLANPFTIVIGAIVGFFAPRFWLGWRKGKRLKAFNEQPREHDHADCQRASFRVVVPPGDRDGRARDPAADLDRVRARHP